MSKIMMTESNAGKFSSHGTRSVALLMTPKKFYGLISVFFLFLIVTTAALFWVHYQSAAEQLSLEDQSTVKPIALVIEEYLGRTIGILEAYAQRPRLVQSFVARNEAQAQVDLAELMQRLGGIESLIITDREGTLRARYPLLSGLAGTNYAHRDWYRGASASWKPYVSEIYQRIVGSKDLAVNLVVPLLDHHDKPIGLLAGTLRLAALSELIEIIPLTGGVSVYVTDRNGHLIYGSQASDTHTVASYPHFPILTQAPTKGTQTIPILNPGIIGSKDYITFSPIELLGGYVSVERTRSSILNATLPHFLQLGITFLLIFLLVAFLLYSIKRQAETRQALEHQKAESELKKIETNYRELFKHMNSGVAVFEAREEGEVFVIRDINETGRRITGLTENPAGRSVCELFPGVMDLGLFAVFQQVWKTGRTVSHPTGLYQDGRLAFWARNDVYKLPTGEVVAIFEDVTEQKEAEEALMTSRRQLAEAMETARLAHWEYDVANDRFTFNDHFYKLFRTSVENIGGYTMTASEYACRFVHPDDLGIVERETRLAIEAVDPHFSRQIEHRVRFADGSDGWISVRFFIVKDAKGRTVKTYGVNQDISSCKRAMMELQESETKYRLLTEKIPDIVWTCDLALRTLYASPSILRVLGFTPDERRRQKLEEQLTPASLAIGLQALEKEMVRESTVGADPDRIVNLVLEYYHKDGSTLWMDTAISGMRNERGELTGLHGVSRDISERIRAEQELNRLNAELEQRVVERTAQLEETNKELETFSYSVSHDLRAPLRRIDGFIQVLTEEIGERLNSTGRSCLERIHNATEQMGRLIDALLRLSRLNKVEMRWERLDLTAMAREIVKTLAESDPVPAREAVVAEGLAVAGDATLLRAVLENLLNNAWKFTGRTPCPRVEFGILKESPDRVFFIRDNGVGFDMAYAGKLFGAFQRLHREEEFPGTGIGLATARRILHRHGGRIWAEAAPGQGATFYFMIPNRNPIADERKNMGKVFL